MSEIERAKSTHYDGRMSWIGALTMPLATFTLWFAVPVLVWGSRYTVSDMGVYVRRGLISRNETTIDAEDIREVELRQGIFGRLMGYGTVTAATAGTGDAEVVFRRCRDPVAARDALNEIKERA